MKTFPGRIVVALLVLLLAAPLGFGEFKEAPMLARLVAAGELPPVDERLPDNPFVVGPGVLNGTQWVDWTPGNYSDGGKSGLSKIRFTRRFRVPDTSTSCGPLTTQRRTRSGP